MYDNSKIASLVGSRLCHDFASPLGSAANGLELMSLSEMVTGPEYDLTFQSLKNVIGRLNVYRVAFGTAHEGSIALSKMVQADLCNVVQDRTTVTCDISGPVDRRHAQSLLLAALCLDKALPHGGQITLSNTGYQFQIAAAGELIPYDTAHWQSLQTGTAVDDLQASHVEFALLPLGLVAQNLSLQITRPTGHLVIGITHTAIQPNKARHVRPHHRRQDT